LGFYGYLLAIQDAYPFVVPEQEVGLHPFPAKNVLLEHYFQLIVFEYVQATAVMF
jgi:hypothetical protein